MDPAVQEKLMRILKKELKYSSMNLAFNMLITKLQKRIAEDPGNMDSCMEEMEAFLAKYPIVAKVDLANIAVL
jgi:hypothetical protein